MVWRGAAKGIDENQAASRSSSDPALAGPRCGAIRDLSPESRLPRD